MAALDSSKTHTIGPPPATLQTPLGLENMICFYWYHHGQCHDFDPSDNQKPSACPFLHHADPTAIQLGVRGKPWRGHSRPCNLPKCPLKQIPADLSTAGRRNLFLDSFADGILPLPKPGTTPSSPAPTSKKRRRDTSSEQVISPALMDEVEQRPITHDSKPKLKIWKKAKIGRCRDRPLPSSTTISKIDYNDSTSPPPLAPPNHVLAPTLQETCFFRYHGHCARSLDRKRNRRCPYQHTLTDPPSMVRPPPGYVHAKPCGLEWCPGDSARSRSGKSNGRRGSSNSLRKSRKIHEADESELKQDSVCSDDDGRSETASCGQPRKEDWFLEGFA